MTSNDLEGHFGCFVNTVMS